MKDKNGNDITDRFVSLDFLFSSEDVVLMQVRRDEQTLAGGEEDNLLTGEYILKPREEQTPEQLCVLAQEYYKRNYDFYPPEAAFTDNGDGTYTIRLYENVDLGEGGVPYRHIGLVYGGHLRRWNRRNYRQDGRSHPLAAEAIR